MKASSIYRDISQYGFAPGKLRLRFGFGSGPKVLANSIPKSGTNLLMRALFLTPQLYRKLNRTVLSDDLEKTIRVLKTASPNQVVAAHLYYSAALSNLIEELEFKNILIVRDPRDIVVSKYFYATYKDKRHYLHAYYQSISNDAQRITKTISGDAEFISSKGSRFYGIDYILNQYIQWVDEPNCLIVRFEDLVGSKGGGGVEEQVNTLSKIYKHIGLDMPEDNVVKIARELFTSNSKTFNKGEIGAWRNSFTSDHVALFKEVCGNHLVRMGYERNLDW